MDLETSRVIAVTIYKITSLVTGVLLCYMGFKLFMAGIWGHSGEVEGSFRDNKIIIKKAAPGTFFVLMGALVLGITISKGIDFKSTEKIERGHNDNEKPKLVD
ncbi:hypothetical protein Nit79A3_1489 [Nitrosomonas sp. Is79A3]|uniref:hypothetical protein n=1 Tax=Nitrosomonas sp. (strain Is79A3) TaxID=261292 RepID=UPI000215D1B8